MIESELLKRVLNYIVLPFIKSLIWELLSSKTDLFMVLSMIKKKCF